MDRQPERFVMISARGHHPATRGPFPATGLADADARAAYATELARQLVRLGHAAELWTLRPDGARPAEEVDGGVIVRRFDGAAAGLIPKERACAWVPSWVAAAAAYLALMPRRGVTLVAHHWEAGVAGRLLAAHFGLPLVHVPHALALDGSWRDDPVRGRVAGAVSSSWRVSEERETNRVASRIIATSAAQRDLLVGPGYGVPAAKVAVVPATPDCGTADAARRFLAALSPVPEEAPCDCGTPGLIEAGLASCVLVEDDSIL